LRILAIVIGGTEAGRRRYGHLGHSVRW
jgi:hypothetical protein